MKQGINLDAVGAASRVRRYHLTTRMHAACS